jgi:hypothetical protein
LSRFGNDRKISNDVNPSTNSTPLKQLKNSIINILGQEYNNYYYKRILIIIKLIYFYRIINITESTYEWPTPIQLHHQLKNLREFHQNFDYKLNHRIICSVCSRFFITTTPHQFVQPFKILFQNKIILSSDNLDDCPIDKTLFEYNQFPHLNGMVLDKDGFNINNTVIN